MKRRMLVWVMVLCLVPLGGWAEEDAYEISTKSWIVRTERGDLDYVEEFHSIQYDEKGLPVTYGTVYRNWTPTHLHTYHRGIIVDSIELDQHESRPEQSLFSDFTAPILEYGFAFDFDDSGNPSALRMTPNTETEVLEFKFENQYEDGVLVCVSITPSIDTSDTIPVYDLFGHFGGYRNAVLDFGRQSYQNKDGKLIRTQRSIGSGIVLDSIEEFQYDGDHLIKLTQTNYVKELPDMKETVSAYHYDPDGRLITITGSNGESEEAIHIAYTEAKDENGRSYDRGTMSADDTDLSESLHATEAFVSCYWHDNGKLAEIVIAPSAQERRVVRYDRQGNEIYNEVYFAYGGHDTHTVKTTNIFYRDWTIIELH